MKLLAIESSGMSAGCAYLEDGVLKSEYYLNTRLTHSATLLPMVEQMQKVSGFELSELDAVAVSAGPGSFTGLRIGAATAKGLGLALELPLVPVSSLKGLAANMICPDVLLCPMMDARRGEVYCGAYLCRSNAEEYTWESVFPDAAMPAEEFLKKVSDYLKENSLKAMFNGDGVPVHKELIRMMLGDSALFAPTSCSRQRASSIAVLGAQEYAKGNTVSSDDFVPEYLRKPLAETSMKDGTLEEAGAHSLKKIARGDFKRTRHPLEDKKETQEG